MFYLFRGYAVMVLFYIMLMSLFLSHDLSSALVALMFIAGPRHNNKSTRYQPVTTDSFALSPGPNDEENLDILGDDDDNVSPNNMTSGHGASDCGFDINLPDQGNMDDEIADVDVNDEADEGLNAAEALRAQVNAEGEQEEQDSSSSSGSSSSSSSSSSSGSGSSDSNGSDGDSASSGADVDI